MQSKNKGSAFEREVCRLLSLWWTADLPVPRDDIFWRTSNSGGRATVRGNKGQTTSGQYGDICAIDPVGESLLKVVTFEIKRGYNKHSIFDLIDKPKDAAKQEWEKWIEQAEASSKLAKTPYWAIISKRDRREPLITCPYQLIAEGTIPHMTTTLPIGTQGWEMVHTMRLSGLLNNCNREFIRKLEAVHDI